MYDNLEHIEGKRNLPGIRRRLYFISKSEIETWPTPPDEEGADSTARTHYTGSFGLVADKKFSYMDVVIRKSQPTSEPQGESESASVLNKLKAVYPLTEEEAADFALRANRDDLVFLISPLSTPKLAVKQKFRVIGHQDFRSITKVTQDLGADASSEKGTTIEVECTDTLFPFYSGSILTSDGDVNPQT